ncbi:uncharacterized protein BP5553_09997 [Venustampulla echinocandica]|uniref:Uncharacterized protein n=1 Tax=Venustampulla echinocandica TaxID=2656787 RepID=A0A370TA37_9HELO|nr:uncharacterized protein BP5553_09997 [Venustampulla echinocandica]RDL30652.1 hypothetical protein BP5553_09997 [Venustampulla echinocandica]
MSSFMFRQGLCGLIICAAAVTFIVDAAPISNSRAAGGFEFSGSPSKPCTASTWQTILIFYATNYLAHIATVRSVPGAKIEHTLKYTLMSLLIPYYGVGRGFEAILRHAIFKHSLISKRADSQLQMALQSGALCIVVRASDWKPVPENESEFVVDNVRLLQRPITPEKEDSNGASEGSANTELRSISSASASPLATPAHIAIETLLILRETLDWDPVINLERNVQGVQHLPQGYTLAILPTFAKVASSFPDTEEEVTISSTWNGAKILITIIQTFYASFTLYETTKGQQTDQYGYAGFGFTVIPYVVMSIINLFGSLVTPDYPTMFLVWSAELKEAQDRGGKFDGIVGTVVSNVADGIDNGKPEARIAVFSRRHGLEQEVEGTVYCNVREPACIPITQPSATNQEGPTTEEVPTLTESEQIEMNTGEDGNHYTANNSSQISTFVVEEGDTCRLRGRVVDTKRYKFTNYEGGFLSFMRRVVIGDDKLKPLFDKKLPRDVIVVPSCTPFEVIPKGQWNNRIFGQIYSISVYLVCAIPFAVIGSLTHFKQGHSTVVQRVFTMGWLAIDILAGNFSVDGKRFASGLHNITSEQKVQTSDWLHFCGTVFWALPFALGGFSVVGIMIRDYDICSAV